MIAHPTPWSSGARHHSEGATLGGMKMTLAAIVCLLVLAPLAGAKDYANCTALNKAYPGGVAKSKAAAAKAVSGGAKKAPAVNAKVYAENASKDRDKDGVACEK